MWRLRCRWPTCRGGGGLPGAVPGWPVPRTGSIHCLRGEGGCGELRQARRERAERGRKWRGAAFKIRARRSASPGGTGRTRTSAAYDSCAMATCVFQSEKRLRCRRDAAKTPRPIRVGFYFEMASLGGCAAAVSLTPSAVAELHGSVRGAASEHRSLTPVLRVSRVVPGSTLRSPR